MSDIINTWIELAINGDREAFHRLLEAHYDMIVRVAWKFTGNKNDAEDIAQDVCMLLVDRLDYFRGECKFSSWLYRIVVNVCKDRFKGNNARIAREQNYHEIEQCMKAEQKEQSKHLAWLYQQMQKLEEGLRETAMLVLAEDLSHRDVAEILQCAESTVSWRMHEIRKILKAAWEQNHE